MGFDEETIAATKSGLITRKADGATVYVNELSPGRYDFTVESVRCRRRAPWVVLQVGRQARWELRVGGVASVRIVYDRQSDAATIYLLGEIPPGGAPRSLMTDLEIKEGAVILLLGEEDQLVGIEVLGASKILPPSVLADAAAAEDPAR